MSYYYPEGALWEMPENRASFATLAAMEQAKAAGKILESRALICDAHHDLIVDMGAWRGIIPREEGAMGIASGATRDIAMISRVNKPVCYKITSFERQGDRVVPYLSRRAAQEECVEQYIKMLRPGDVIPARVTRLDSFGCFVDIGCGLPSLIPIDAISVSRISHPRDRFLPGQSIYAIVRSVEEGGRVCLSHKELLGTWEENAAHFSPGGTVSGIVRSVENYGVFVELAPNLAGLAEPKEGVHAGQHASVYIKSLIPERMKIKLILVDAFDGEARQPEFTYYFTGSHMDYWRYSPENSHRTVETVFGKP